MLRWFTFSLALIFLAIPLSRPAIAQPVIGISFPPTRGADHLNFTFDKLSTLNITHIRIAEHWKFREPNRGQFNWEPLEQRISALHGHGLKILLTIQSDGPDWACTKRNTHSCLFSNFEDMQPYLSQLLVRIGGKIDAIQFGNEWDHQFVGSAEDYLKHHNAFYQLVKQIRPNLDVVLGGITARGLLFETMCLGNIELDTSDLELTQHADLNLFIQAEICTRQQLQYANDRNDIQMVLGQAKYDFADLHLYDTPQLWDAFVRIFDRLSSKPIYITEFGGPNPDLESQDNEYQARRLSTYLSTIATLPVIRAYYFKLTDDDNSYHNRSGLFDQKGNPKPAFDVFLNR